MPAKRTPLPKKRSPIPPTCTLEREYVLCGKPNCARKHGPYWYAYWKDGKRTRKRYVGSNEALARLLESWGPRAKRNAYDEDDVQDMREWNPRKKGKGSRPRRPWARGGNLSR
jgi:hypothetical protein